MRPIQRFILLTLTASLITACGKSPDNVSTDAPLAYAPADTPYVWANPEPMPAAVIDHWSQQMHDVWPIMIGIYENALGNMPALDDRERRIVSALLDELKTHDSWDKLRELGFKPDARFAVYGVGLVPVARLELGDANAFRATIARIEQKVGEKIPVEHAGTQDYWRFGDAKVIAILAIQGTHLVATIAPTNASDALKQALLGIARPAQSLQTSGVLGALAKEYGFSPYGQGFVDVAQLTQRLGNPPAGSDLEVATALGLPTTGGDAACKTEFADLARQFPRVAMGAEEMSAQRVRISIQAEFAPALAQEIAAALTAAPGTGAPGQGLADLAVSMPLLKLKDFWIKQADAVTAKPYTCSSLVELNSGFRDFKTKIDITVPPPFSDLTGMRFVLDKAEPRADGIPDMAGRVLLGSTNPMAALAMAQLTVPGLSTLKISADGKPVAVPAAVVPPGVPPVFAAMSDKALAVGVGAGEDTTLSAFLAAPVAPDPVFMRMYFSGAIYGLLARFQQQLAAKMPAAQAAQVDTQVKLFTLYEKWIRSGEIIFVANSKGIAMHEVVEQK